MCIVVDLLLGGDLRYHLGKTGPFCKHDILIYLLEVSSALDYLHSHQVVHRWVNANSFMFTKSHTGTLALTGSFVVFHAKQ